MAGVDFVGQCAEYGEQEKGKNIVQSHDNAADALAHTEFVCQGERDGCVIGLPECAYEEKSKTDANCSFVIEFHFFAAVLVL